jgi:hypothetical protein
LRPNEHRSPLVQVGMCSEKEAEPKKSAHD